MTGGGRRAGISVPLFSLRSTRGWGIGEIGDLPAIADWLRSAHQSVLQILPLNELAPEEYSPYSPLSAMAIDPQFISLWMMDIDINRETDQEIEIARRAPRVDYHRVRALKTRALREAFQRFVETDWRRDKAEAGALREYIGREAWWLDEYALYRALRHESGERSWTEWPAELRDRDPAALAAARERLADQVLYYQYVQWVAAVQWQSMRRHLEGVEIVGDCPFMVTLDSADVWSRRSDFLLDASVGTPPDAFSETGQQWGLPPYDWEAARRNDFEWLRMRARRLAELYDGFRVDHLVGFYRTYVRPLNGDAPRFEPATEAEQTALGEAVLRIFMDTGAGVSVEDLGTIPDFVRESIARLGLPGYKVLRWEVDDPRTFPPVSVAMTGTHDTETIAEWWNTLAIEERRRFGVESPFDPTVLNGILSLLYNAGSNVVLLPIQDAFGWRERINLPGTIGEANWTFVLPWPIDRVAEYPLAREGADRLAELSYRTGRWNPPVEQDD
jgi:4-alpha-glucanotransferase